MKTGLSTPAYSESISDAKVVRTMPRLNAFALAVLLVATGCNRNPDTSNVPPRAQKPPFVTKLGGTVTCSGALVQVGDTIPVGSSLTTQTNAFCDLHFPESEQRLRLAAETVLEIEKLDVEFGMFSSTMLRLKRGTLYARMTDAPAMLRVECGSFSVSNDSSTNAAFVADASGAVRVSTGTAYVMDASQASLPEMKVAAPFGFDSKRRKVIGTEPAIQQQDASVLAEIGPPTK